MIGPNMADFQVTPNRRTKAIFDVEAKYLIEGAVAISRTAEQAFKGPRSRRNNIRVTKGVGIELEAKQYSLATIHETTDVPLARILTPSAGNVNVPSGIEDFYTNRTPDAPGAAANPSANAATQSDPFIDHKIAASTNWNGPEYDLEADRNAYVSPESDLDTFPMLRRLTSLNPHSYDDDITFRFKCPAHDTSIPNCIVTLYFGAPAGCDEVWTGYGQYAVKFGGDGMATMFERCYRMVLGVRNEDWVKRKRFRYSEVDRVMRAAHVIHIRIVPDLLGRTPWALGNGKIVFEVASSDEATTQRGGGLFAKYMVAPNNYSFTVPYTQKYRVDGSLLSRVKPPPAQPELLRIDARQDIRPQYQVSYMYFPTEGDWRDDPIVTQQPTYDVSKLFRVMWFGHVPAGCTARMRLYDYETDQELTQVGTVETITNQDGDVIGGYCFYQPQAGKTVYQPGGEGTSNQHQSPRITHYMIERQAVFAFDDGSDAFDTDFPTATGMRQIPWSFNNVSITGAQSNPDEETASFRISDLTRHFAQFDSRASIPTEILTTVDEVNQPGVFTCLFRGFTERVTGEQRGSKLLEGLMGPQAAYPAIDWKQLDFTLVSEWLRVLEGSPPKRWFWTGDPASAANNKTVLPYKVTDACHIILNWSGYDDDEIDIPDIDFRFWPTGDDNEAMMMDPLSSNAEALMHFSRDYLGKFFVRCHNSSPLDNPHERGMWRMRTPATPPYNPLAHFYTTNQVDAGKLVHWVGSWPSVVGELQDSPSIYVIKKSLRTWMRRPEANLICVSGTGYGLYENTPDQLTITLPNYKSFNFAGLPLGHPKLPSKTNNPDYLGRMVRYLRVDNALTLPDAVKWTCHRIFDRATHGAKCITFAAPALYVWDSQDALQFRPRKLRFYDPITVNGTVFLVRSCNLETRKDGKQIMIINAELPNGVMA